MKTKLTIGSDPEYMVAVDEKIVCAIPIVNFHSKHDKIPLSREMESVYYDGAMIEGTIQPGATTEETVESFRSFVRNSSMKLAEKRGKMLAVASHNFDPEELVHPDARAAGCSPEFCAYEICAVEPPALGQTNFRSAGGHIHIGRQDWKDPQSDFLVDPMSIIGATRAMDFYVGVAFTFLENDPTAPARKALYGKAGRHRPTDYGFEYRTLGNSWTSHPKLVAFADKLTRFAVGEAEENRAVWENAENKEVIEIINSGNSEKAMEFAQNNFPNDIVEEMVELKTIPYDPDLINNYQ